MKLLPLLLSVFLAGTVVDGCAKKKKPATAVQVPADNPPPTVPTPPPQDPNPSTPQDPSSPTPTNPELLPLPPVALDQSGDPIIPRTPVVDAPHVIFNSGATAYYSGTVSSNICQDRNVKAYYKPCDPNGLYCFFTPSCGYFTCTTFSF
jgi:hypothetical protein